MENDVTSSQKQLWLIPYRNPLKEKITRDRVKELPNGPGVYLFFDATETLLYVGKAKCLRKRVNSYRSLNPERASRKIMRLVHTASSVRFISSENEMKALLMENDLIRKHRPPFNSANAKPESYHYFGVKTTPAEESIRLSIRIMASPTDETDHVFGAFKNRGSLQKIYATLLRALWLSKTPPSQDLDYPHALLVSRLPPDFEMSLPLEKVQAFLRFMTGHSEDFLKTYDLWNHEEMSAFSKAWITRDREALQAFSLRSAKIIAMTQKRGLSRAWITPSEVDDFPVEDGPRFANSPS